MRIAADIQIGRDPDTLDETLSAGSFDFLDFGCSKGGSLRFAKRKLGGRRGLGIDIDARKVNETLEAGFEACEADIRELAAYPDCVKFVVMSHFLEHLPSLGDADACIETACTAARNFVFIRQPWFDSDGYLFARKLKLYWSDWDGHPNAMTSLQLFRSLRRIQNASQFRIYGKDRIWSSENQAIIPLSAKKNSHEWDSAQHGEKPKLDFEIPVYRELAAFVSFGSTNLDDIEGRVENLEKLFDSESSCDK